MKIFLIVLGVCLALLGGACTAGGSALLIVAGGDGYLETGSATVSVDSPAIVSDRDQLIAFRTLNDPEHGEGDFKLRVRAESRDPSHEIFIGVAPAAAFEDYSRDARLDLVYHVSVSPPQFFTYPVEGTHDLDPPTRQDFWLASVSGPGQQELVWTPGLEEARLVVMNADGSPGLEADVSVGLNLRFLRAGAIFLALIGLAVAAAGIVLIVIGARRKSKPPFVPVVDAPWPPPPPPPPQATA